MKINRKIRNTVPYVRQRFVGDGALIRAFLIDHLGQLSGRIDRVYHRISINLLGLSGIIIDISGKITCNDRLVSQYDSVVRIVDGKASELNLIRCYMCLPEIREHHDDHIYKNNQEYDDSRVKTYRFAEFGNLFGPFVVLFLFAFVSG